jgi:hypothetical protein
VAIGVIIAVVAATSDGGHSPTASVSSQPTRPNLATAVLPLPAGYAMSTSPNSHNGPISQQQFNQLADGSGTAASLGFTRGYEITYDSTDPTSPDSVEIVLATFSTEAAAKNFVSILVASFLVDQRDQSVVQHPYPGIAGAIELDGTRFSRYGAVDYAVVAARGAAIMGLDYTTDRTGPPPAVFRAWAASQYRRL